MMLHWLLSTVLFAAMIVLGVVALVFVYLSVWAQEEQPPIFTPPERLSRQDFQSNMTKEHCQEFDWQHIEATLRKDDARYGFDEKYQPDGNEELYAYLDEKISMQPDDERIRFFQCVVSARIDEIKYSIYMLENEQQALNEGIGLAQLSE